MPRPTLTLDERKEYEKRIGQMTPLERGIFADMIMRSLRNSWRRPAKRSQILERIPIVTYDIKYYDGSALRQKCVDYFENIGRRDPDGRFWRRTYQNADVDYTELSKNRIRELAEMIPHDRKWDERAIDEIYDGQ